MSRRLLEADRVAAVEASRALVLGRPTEDQGKPDNEQALACGEWFWCGGFTAGVSGPARVRGLGKFFRAYPRAWPSANRHPTVTRQTSPTGPDRTRIVCFCSRAGAQ